MTSNFIIKDQDSYEPYGKVICLPKTTIQSEFSKDKNLLQDFIIDDWILRKFGLI